MEVIIIFANSFEKSAAKLANTFLTSKFQLAITLQ